MIEQYGVHIDFAYLPFVWDSEAQGKAKVHCVIIGFSGILVTSDKKLFDTSSKYKICKNISPYLIDMLKILYIIHLYGKIQQKSKGIG